MTEKRNQAIERRETERRELEAAGWESNGKGAKAVWKSPGDGRWYAHYQALQVHRKNSALKKSFCCTSTGLRTWHVCKA
jgi:hypothetical protein